MIFIGTVVAAMASSVEYSCGYCLSEKRDMFDPRKLPCGHRFCLECLLQDFQRSPKVTCIICRQEHGVLDVRTLESCSVEDMYCDFCERRNPAEIICITCDSKLCKKHAEEHDIQNKLFGETHESKPALIISLTEPVDREGLCRKHNEELQGACSLCQGLLCFKCLASTDCTQSLSQRHTVIYFHDKTDGFRKVLNDELAKLWSRKADNLDLDKHANVLLAEEKTYCENKKKLVDEVLLEQYAVMKSKAEKIKFAIDQHYEECEHNVSLYSNKLSSLNEEMEIVRKGIHELKHGSDYNIFLNHKKMVENSKRCLAAQINKFKITSRDISKFDKKEAIEIEIEAPYQMKLKLSKVKAELIECKEKCDKFEKEKMVMTQRNEETVMQMSKVKTELIECKEKCDKQELVSAEPYSIVIAHSGTVEVSGSGIKYALLNQLTKFNVEVKNTAIGQPIVVIKDPSGKQVPCNVREESKGKYSVSYTPIVAGAFHVEVLSEGKHVSGSPLSVLVNRLPTAQVPSQGELGKPVIIELHSMNSGTGVLNISVNDGTVEAQTRKLAKDHFIAEFIPGSLEPHIIDVEFNSIPLIGSPWKIDIENKLQEGTSTMPMQRAKVGEPRSFLVSAKKAVELNIVDPKGKPVPYSLTPTAEGMSAHYTFSVVGDHQIHVKCDGKPVMGSPFLARVFDPLLVYVKDLRNTAQLNQEIAFSVDTKLAGEGTVSVLIDKGKTLCSVTQVKETLYRAKFVASRTGANQVCVMFNNYNVKDSPFSCNVEGLSFQLPKVVPLNQNVEIMQFHQGQVPADLNINVTDPKGKVLAGQTITKNGILQVLFKAVTVGQHNIEVVAGGKVVAGGPYQVSVIDPSRLIVSSYAPELEVNIQSKIIINDEGCGSQDIRVQVYAPDGSQVQSLMTPTATGYELTFMPTQRGIYSTKIMLYGIQIRGSPLQQTAKVFMVSIVKPLASGLGLHFCEKDKTASFQLRGNHQNGQPDLRIEGPHSVAKYEMQKLNDAAGGTYEVTYTPVETGIYSIYIKWNGSDMEGSPFHPHVIDPRQVTIDGDWNTHLDSGGRLEMKLGQTKKVLLDVTGAGPGELSASGKYISGGNQLPIKIVEKDQSHYWLEITPNEVGEASISVLWSDRHVLHSPVTAIVIGGSNGMAAGSGKVALTGKGLGSIIVGKETEFFIDGIIADSGSPGVILKSSQLQHIPVALTQLTATEYKCTYSVDSPGTYMLHISWNGRDLSRSPYTVLAKSGTKVSPLTGAEAVKVYGIGINPGILYNYKGDFFIDTKSAGKGQCSIKMIGPKGDVKFNVFQDQHDDRLLIVRYEPTGIGIYIVQVKWSNEDVPQSPIKVYIFDTHEELNRFTTAGELPYHFTKTPNFTSLLSDINRPFSKVSKTEEREYRSLYMPCDNENNVMFVPSLQRAYSAQAHGHPTGSHVKKPPTRATIFIGPESDPDLFK